MTCSDVELARIPAICCALKGALAGWFYPQLLHDTKEDTSRTPTLPIRSLLGRAWPTVTSYDQSMPGGTAYAPAIHAQSISVLHLEAFASRPANVVACARSTERHGLALNVLKC